jgi:ankyrin repeat protein
MFLEYEEIASLLVHDERTVINGGHRSSGAYMTPLMYTAEMGLTDLARCLIMSGQVDVNVRNNKDYSALDYAIQKIYGPMRRPQKISIVEMFLRSGQVSDLTVEKAWSTMLTQISDVENQITSLESKLYERRAGMTESKIEVAHLGTDIDILVEKIIEEVERIKR